MKAADEDDTPPDEAALPAVAVADIAARVIYRDALVLVIDKPAGLPVHAGPGGGAHLGLYLDKLRFGLPRLPQLAHRLDRDTSGCLALGRHAEALRRLGKLFMQGRVDKLYWAVVQGSPAEERGQIKARLLRVLGEGGRRFRMVVDAAGQEAVTDYAVLGQRDGMSWLELRPQTGRTHQLRVHCAAMGCPIIGDVKYGTADAAGLQLHARNLTLPLYPKKPPVTAAAAPPEAMARLLQILR